MDDCDWRGLPPPPKATFGGFFISLYNNTLEPIHSSQNGVKCILLTNSSTVHDEEYPVNRRPNAALIIRKADNLGALSE